MQSTRVRFLYHLLVLAAVLSACSPQERKNDSALSENNGGTAPSASDNTGMMDEATDPGSLAVINRPHYHTVEIRQMKFIPDELVVAKGDTVVWVNNGITAHDVTEQPDEKWTSASMPVGASWRMVINETSDYYCSIHVVMKGKLVVK